MEKTIYHGSERKIKKPIYGYGKTYNDYGLGFYCTESPELAAEWAVEENRDGFVNCYSIETDGLTILDLNSEDYTILHWMAVLVTNRQFELNTPLSREAFRYLRTVFKVDVSEADIITGYRADDSYFAYAQDFLNGIISLSQLSKALRLGNLGEQIMLRSEEAFNRISYHGSSIASSEEWYEKKKCRDTQAREIYRKMNKQDYIPGDLYMIRIIDEEIKADDPRIQ